MELLTLMLRHDVQPPPSVIILFTKRLVDDSLRVRKVSPHSEVTQQPSFGESAP